MFNLTFSGTQVLLGTGLLLLGLGILYTSLKYYFNRKIENSTGESSRTKYDSVNVFKYHTTFFRVGLLSVLAFTLMAFNWTQFSVPVAVDDTIWEPIVDLDNAPPITDQKPPPPPPPPLPIFEPVPDELVKDTIVFKSRDTDSKQVIPPPRKRKVIPPPPPIPQNDDDYVKFAEHMPAFGDCGDETSEDLRRTCSSQALMEFIGKKVRYPAIAVETGIEGTAVIRFVVEKDGSMSNLEIVRDPGGKLGQEALRVANLLTQQEKWAPGKQNGRPVRVQFNLPVKFKLH